MALNFCSPSVNHRFALNLMRRWTAKSSKAFRSRGPGSIAPLLRAVSTFARRRFVFSGCRAGLGSARGPEKWPFSVCQSLRR